MRYKFLEGIAYTDEQRRHQGTADAVVWLNYKVRNWKTHSETNKVDKGLCVLKWGLSLEFILKLKWQS